MRAQNANIVAIVKAIISLNRELFATILLALSRVCVCVCDSVCALHYLPPPLPSMFLRFSPRKKREKKEFNTGTCS